jgi:hypothetical protein
MSQAEKWAAAASGMFPTIDRAQLRALLRCYFRMSATGKLAQPMGRGKDGRSRSFVFLLVLYGAMGLMTGMLAFAGVDVFTYALIVHGMTFMVVGMAMTAEAGDALFNPAENDVLRHRPIHPSTLLLAKTMNFLGFALLLAGALNFFPIWFGLAARGARWWFPLVHALSVVLLGVFCAASVVCVYGLIMRFFDREKFDNFAVWSQVGMSLLFTFGYQAVPRLMDQLTEVSIESYAAYLALLPPAWFAALDGATAGSMQTPVAFGLASLGLGSTAVLSYVAIGRLAPSYGEGLARLAESRPRKRAPRAVSTSSMRARNPLMRLWLRDPLERSAFRLAATYLRRDREVKLRLYPALASFLFIPLMALINPSEGFHTVAPLMTVGLLSTLPLTALGQLRMSSHHAAAEVFAVAPIPSAAPLFQGARKATVWFLLCPALALALLLLVVVAPGSRRGLLLALPAVLALPTMSLVPGVFEEYLPLSRPVDRMEATSRTALIMWGSLIAMAVVALAAYLAWTWGVFWHLVGIEAIVLGVLHVVWTGWIRRRSIGR